MTDTNLAVTAIKGRGGLKSASGLVGVYLQKPKSASHRWVARVTLADGTLKAVPGRYDTAAEAAAARAAFIKQHGVAAPKAEAKAVTHGEVSA